MSRQHRAAVADGDPMFVGEPNQRLERRLRHSVPDSLLHNDDALLYAHAKKGMITPFYVRFKGETLIKWTSILRLAVLVTLAILLIVNNHYNWNMYTFWSLAILIVYRAALTLSLYIQHLPFTVVVLFGFPLVFGNAVLVCLAILVIIANNAHVLTDGSVCSGGEISMETLNTFHWILHGYPVLDMFIDLVLIFYYIRKAVIKSLYTFSALGVWAYFGFVMLGTLVPIGIYQLIFDVDKQYPTSFSGLIRNLIMLAIVEPCQLFLWFAMTAIYTSKQIHFWWLPTIAQYTRPPTKTPTESKRKQQRRRSRSVVTDDDLDGLLV